MMEYCIGGCNAMATKSFLKDVTLRDAKQCQSFIRALEKSQAKRPKPPEASIPARDLTKEQIGKLFGGTQ